MIDGYQIVLFKFDCNNKKIGIGTITTYLKSGKVVKISKVDKYDIEMDSVIPDSIGEGIFNKFCRKMIKMELNNRINEIIKDLGVKPTQFARLIGLKSETTIFKIIRNEREVSGNIISKIGENMPEINMDWFLYGKGNMWSKTIISNRLTEESVKNCDTVAKRLQKIIDTLLLGLNSFSRKLGVANTTVRDILIGKCKTITLNVLEKLKIVYPEINQMWLITGKGKPIRK